MSHEPGDIRIDRRLSRWVAQQIAATPNQCWRNAWVALTSQPELAGGLYVEGWVVPLKTPLVIAHGWVEYNEIIVDPTLWTATLVYFPALRWTAKQIHTARHLPIARAGRAGSTHPKLDRAFEDAWAYVRWHMQL